MGLGGRIKDMIKGWLDINEASQQQFNIYEMFNFDTNAIRNEIWYRGDPFELSQFYKQINDSNAYFWSSVPDIKIRKIHSGLPALIVDTLTGIVIRDLNTIEASDTEWDEINKDNMIYDIVRKSVVETLYQGDGAFKISFDKSVSDYPIIEFFNGSRCEFVYRRGHYYETVFKTIYVKDYDKYVLYETYGFGYIKYRLVKARTNTEVPLSFLDETANLADVRFAGYNEDKDGKILSRGAVNLAVPMKFYDSAKYPNRGKSIFENKFDVFDGFDEVVSQWADAVRAGRTTKYIPESLLPRDINTGRILKGNDFDNRYIALETSGNENDKNEIKVIQPAIPVESYIQSYITFLDLCLQGIISPSTLGIDTKKLDNAEAQREKEKTTLYTRGVIIEALQKTIPQVINTALKAIDCLNSRSIRDDIDITVEFGEYANPSFEAVVETVAKAKQGGIMSIEASIDELYGDTKDDEWKQKEINRLKEEQGIAEMQEPLLDDDVNIDDNPEGVMTDDSINKQE